MSRFVRIAARPLVLIVVIALPALVFASDSSGGMEEIHACVKTNGQVRIVDNPSDCRTQEELVSWNQVGPEGAAGADGLNGADGMDGADGSAGVAGADGMNGAAGVPGPAGPRGLIGLTGPAGANGRDGVDGRDGVNGIDGAPGATGPAGPAGMMGLPGAIGAVGPAGVVGAVGPAGPGGVAGAVGPAGAVGSAGADGAIGPTGAGGPAGPVGLTGGTGLTGPAGPAGPSGPPGGAVVEDPAAASGACDNVFVQFDTLDGTSELVGRDEFSELTAFGMEAFTETLATPRPRLTSAFKHFALSKVVDQNSPELRRMAAFRTRIPLVVIERDVGGGGTRETVLKIELRDVVIERLKTSGFISNSLVSGQVPTEDLELSADRITWTTWDLDEFGRRSSSSTGSWTAGAGGSGGSSLSGPPIFTIDAEARSAEIVSLGFDGSTVLRNLDSTSSALLGDLVDGGIHRDLEFRYYVSGGSPAPILLERQTLETALTRRVRWMCSGPEMVEQVEFASDRVCWEHNEIQPGGSVTASTACNY